MEHPLFARRCVSAGDTTESAKDKVPCTRGTCTTGEGVLLVPIHLAPGARECRRSREEDPLVTETPRSTARSAGG